ncbi:hypothetical protein L210DRAFT_3508201 [Boletus edulis BED1]|uniref:Uncharacterized protein n=1 Tax=Boletus edulis BED1 TaxID=1328754 RepID=A0AAD4BHI6_BOLED|nr:hypothetical protein L210DRAFT_3508201 [Boletus edulis BED1]
MSATTSLPCSNIKPFRTGITAPHRPLRDPSTTNPEPQKRYRMLDIGAGIGCVTADVLHLVSDVVLLRGAVIAVALEAWLIVTIARDQLEVVDVYCIVYEEGDLELESLDKLGNWVEHKETEEHEEHEETEEHKEHKETEEHKEHKETEEHKEHKETEEHKEHKETEEHKEHKETEEHKEHKETEEHKEHKETEEHKEHKETEEQEEQEEREEQEETGEHKETEEYKEKQRSILHLARYIDQDP